LKIYDWLGQVYAFQGSPVESEHYYRQGLEIAKSNFCKTFASKFNGALSDIECRRYHLEKSQELFASVEFDKNMAPRDSAGFDATRGRIFKSGKEYEKSVGEYGNAVGTLEKAMERDFVREIDVSSVMPDAPPKPATTTKRAVKGKEAPIKVVKRTAVKTKDPTETQGTCNI
jgi:hypothetical protein